MERMFVAAKTNMADDLETAKKQKNKKTKTIKEQNNSDVFVQSGQLWPL